MPADLSFDPESARILQANGFDRIPFEALRARLRGAGAGAGENNILRGQIEPPAREDVLDLDALPAPAKRELVARGEQALAGGQVAALVLAGGMATRFGGMVKAAVEAVDGRSFLDLKLGSLAVTARTAGIPIPAYLMASFATADEIRALGEALRSPEVPVATFTQFASVRLTPRGDIFRGDDGRVSLYAPGHGDLPFAVRNTGVLARLRAAGVRFVFISNVDNLAATLDPLVVGAHLAGGRPVTVEVVAKDPGDRGGAPARVDGVLQIVESFRFPAHFDQDRIAVFNTNTFMIDLDALERDFELDWFAVTKQIDGRDAVQFERLLGQVTAFLPSHFVKVPRSGGQGRFQPVKDPPELAARTAEIRDILRERGVLR